MLIARIWDAINDPMWGSFVDSRKPTRFGRFRPYIFGASFPFAIAMALMFVKIPGLSTTGYLIYAYITYIFFGMMYTGPNIPYGSLASAITDDDMERSSLSMWRSIGAGLGGLPAQILLPLLVYSVGAGGEKVLDSNKLTAAELAASINLARTGGLCRRNRAIPLHPGNHFDFHRKFRIGKRYRQKLDGNRAVPAHPRPAKRYQIPLTDKKRHGKLPHRQQKNTAAAPPPTKKAARKNNRKGQRKKPKAGKGAATYPNRKQKTQKPPQPQTKSDEPPRPNKNRGKEKQP